jgi:hypothetical protein
LAGPAGGCGDRAHCDRGGDRADPAPAPEGEAEAGQAVAVSSHPQQKLPRCDAATDAVNPNH